MVTISDILSCDVCSFESESKEELDSKHKSKYTHTEYFEMFYKKEVFLKKYKVDNFEWKIYPRLIYFNFDLSCNYQCPSCRLQTIPNKKDKITARINITIPITG